MNISRRSFLLGSGGLAAGGLVLPLGRMVRKEKAVKIDRVELFPVRYPMTGYFKFFTGPRGSLGRAAVIVKITADNGAVGWGQSVPIARWSYETLETAEIVLRDYYAAVLKGRDPTDIKGALSAMDSVVAPGFSTGMPISRAGVDIALHDLTGKLAGKPLAELWGLPAGGSITLSWTVNPKKLEDLDGIVEQGKERGYRNFNIKAGGKESFDVELAAAVRKLAPSCFLWADANGGYDPETALSVAPKLAEAGVDVLEAPLKPNRISGYIALKKQGALPVLMDEGVVSPVELREFIKLNMLDGVAVKPARCGGLLSCKKQIELLVQKGLMWLGSGLTDPDISLAASLCLYGAFGLKKPAALNGPQFLTYDILKEPLKVKEGRMEVPKGPGLGVEVDEDKLNELVSKRKTL